MKLLKFSPILAIFIAVFFASCNKEDVTGNLVMNYEAKFENQPFALNQVYLLNGDSVVFTKFRYYLSDITTEDKDGTESISISELELIDFSNGNVSKQFEMKEGAYKNFYMGLGLNAAQNATVPSDYTADHPLSLTMGNYWMMLNSYIFVELEGDFIKNGVTTGMAYHIGTDALKAETSNENRSYTIHEDNNTTIQVVIDVATLFEGLSLPSDVQTHTSNNLPLAQMVMDNFAANITIN